MSGDAINEERCLALDKMNTEPLEEMLDSFILLYACLSGLGGCQFLEMVLSYGVPAPKGFQGEGNRPDPLILAGLKGDPALVEECKVKGMTWRDNGASLKGLVTMMSGAVSHPPSQGG